MSEFSRRSLLITSATAAVALFAGSGALMAEDLAMRSEIDADADAALARLFAENEAAKTFSKKANALLIFPKITEAGIAGIGGMRGKGVLRQNGKSIGYYRTTSLSFGVDLGFERHGYVVMFMTEAKEQKFASVDSVEFGTSGEVTIVKNGVTSEVDTMTANADVVAFIFDEKGFRLDLTLDGTKINKMNI